MASVENQLLNLSVTSRPPSGKTDSVCTGGFQYRGRLFSATRQRTSQDSNSPSVIPKPPHENRLTECERPKESLNQAYSSQSPQSVHCQARRPRKIQSATGRLERNKISKKFSSSSCQPSQTFKDLGEKRPSVINLDKITDVPDCEEETLMRIASVRGNSAKSRENFLAATAIRPSSAKGAIGSPVVKSEVTSVPPDATDRIKPSVYGLKIGRQVYGGGSEILEAWKNTDHDFPYKLSTENNETNVKELVLKETRYAPSTLHPLERWKQDSVPSRVTGLDPTTCLIYLLDDYQDIELPEVPAPQAATDDLPYSCIVETPRQNVTRQYIHPFFEKDFSDENWKCKHNEGVFNPGAISSFKYQSLGPRTSEKIRREIAELEDLLNGIGSLSSNCSFVQFQAEIDNAKDLAAKLFSLKQRESEEEKDTFGLLKLYRDHEKIIAELHQRRNECLQELSLLEDT